MDIFQSENSSKIEKITKAVALESLYEGFLEAFPQLLLKMYVISKTGEISRFTLTLIAVRAFFIQRGEDTADPEPSFHMLAVVFPAALVTVLCSALQYLIMVSMVPWSIFLATPTILLVTYLALRIKEGKWNNLIAGKNHKEDFKVPAAVTSLFLPCVVGNDRVNFLF